MKLALLAIATAVALGLAGTASARGLSPDDRAVPRGPSPAPSGTLAPDDRPFSRAPDLASEPTATLVRVSKRSFDWTDAAVGATSGFGIALLAFGGVILVRRRRVPTRALLQG